ncbi:MAG: uracil-DNA glycosylase [Thermoclostridium sp.]|nr:uracil-DNA glycosylase [Thermoclostridium sp.]
MLPENVSPSWNGFLTDEILSMLESIGSQIGLNYTPAREKILRFLTWDLNTAKVVIIGQDVYFQPGVATGRSFEVGGLQSWDQPFRQVSLKNMVRLIHKSYRGITRYESILKFSEIVLEIKEHSFPMLPPQQLFDSLEAQGVLFLNTYLTCEMNKPNSHRLIWEGFSRRLFDYISSKRPDLHWFLWGNEAISKAGMIRQGVLSCSRHPMLCSEKYTDDFLKSACFQNTMQLVNWLG